MRNLLTRIQILFALIFSCHFALAELVSQKTLVFFDFESPQEVECWLKELDLRTDICSPGVYACNEKFLVYRPTASGKINKDRDMTKWLLNHKIKPDGVFITGHHSAGFFGQNGTLSLQEISKLANKDSSILCQARFLYLGACNTLTSGVQTQDPAAYIHRVIQHAEQKSDDKTELTDQELELLSNAIQQYTNSNIGIFWPQAFPNSFAIGFNDSQITSTQKMCPMIRGLAQQMMKSTGAKSFSDALFTQIDNMQTQKVKASAKVMNDNIRFLSKFSKQTGIKVVATKPSAECVSTMSEDALASLQQSADMFAPLKRFLEMLIENDVQKYSWLQKLDKKNRATLIENTIQALQSQDLSDEQNSSVTSLIYKYESQNQNQN